MHLIDSPPDTSEVEQHYALNNSIAIIMVVHVKIDLIKLSMLV